MLMSVLVALAAPPPASSASVAGPAELPLLRGPDGDVRPYVTVRVGEADLVFRVATGHREVRVSAAAASLAGLDVRGGSTDPDAPKNGRAVAPLGLGGATVEDVRLTVVNGAWPDVADGELGLLGFPELAWKLERSRAALVVAPKGSVGQRPGGIAGTLPQPGVEHARIGADRIEIAAPPLSFSAVIDGATIPATVCVECPASSLAGEWGAPTPWKRRDGRGHAGAAVPLAAAPTYREGPLVMEHRAWQVGGEARVVVLGRPGFGPRFDLVTPLTLGGAAAAQVDLWIDPGSSSWSAAAAPAVAGSSLLDVLVARARKEAEGAPTGGETDGASPDARARAWSKVGALELRAHRPTEAVRAFESAVTAAPGQCSYALALGKARLALGDAAGATAAFTRADELYAPWAARPLAERQELRDRAQRAAGEADRAGPEPQDGVCHEAVGWLAVTMAAAGRDVAGLYPARLDLDPHLPLAAGNAALARGALEEARAAYLQVLTLRRGAEDPYARAGLALALRPSHAEAALAQLGRISPWILGSASESAGPLVYRALAPTDAEALAQLARHRPADPELLSALALAGRAAEGDRADALYAERLAFFPDDGRALAGRALLLLGRGEVSEAASLADRATRVDPGSPWGWYALAQVAAARGEDATAPLQRARLAGALLPGWAGPVR